MKSNKYLNVVPKSSFLSAENDSQKIIEKLFVQHPNCANTLKKLLVVNTKDCLENPKYNDIIKDYSIKRLIDEHYIQFNPKFRMNNHEEIKSYLLFTFDNFIPTDNGEYRDCTIFIDVLTHHDYWDLGNFRQRPFKMMGYVDGLLNGTKLTGIGTLNFAGANYYPLDENISGYTMAYTATHGVDDTLEKGE